MNLSTQRDDLLREHVISPVCVYISFCGYGHSQRKRIRKHIHILASGSPGLCHSCERQGAPAPANMMLADAAMGP